MLHAHVTPRILTQAARMIIGILLAIRRFVDRLSARIKYDCREENREARDSSDWPARARKF